MKFFCAFIFITSSVFSTKLYFIGEKNTQCDKNYVVGMRDVVTIFYLLRGFNQLLQFVQSQSIKSTNSLRLTPQIRLTAIHLKVKKVGNVFQYAQYVCKSGLNESGAGLCVTPNQSFVTQPQGSIMPRKNQRIHTTNNVFFLPD